ncbi:unnamed protein product [Moneuplotes crassus]|uniref:HotDog ACOT-type domain-containing protein n=1 Tax=Euplotes crassus TaxID=5936 RepID=A0AAD1XAZ4_EUPCR|nr:unnamed protein product [Moneuplotes crassus]
MHSVFSKRILTTKSGAFAQRKLMTSRLIMNPSMFFHQASSAGFRSYNCALNPVMKRIPPFGIKQLFRTPARGYVSDLAEAHEMYGLFRKGQNIGYLSTLMEDPSDAKLVTKENYKDELNFYHGIPELAENIFDKLVQIKVSSCSKVPFNSPTGTWLQVIYPFAENQRLADKYRKFADGHLLVGKLLEEIDALCAESAYRFIRGNSNDLSKVSKVTAAVDQVEFKTPLLVDENLKINTYVIYCGSSTIYTKADIYSQEKGSDKWKYKGHTIFIMAARKGDKAYKLPKMVFEGEEYPDVAKPREALGEELKNYIINLNTDLFKQPPNRRESEHIYELFKKQKFGNPKEYKTVSDTVLSHNTLMQPQETNTYGKIFGGYLMNRAAESAVMNVKKFTEEVNPEILYIDTIKFIKPVEVGHIMQFISRITYTTGNMMRVAVSALDITEKNKEGDLTNEFHFVFKLKGQYNIYPGTYYDSLLYLEGKRRTEYLLNF